MKKSTFTAGIANSDYVQIDDISARVNGVNQNCQIVCNPLFSAYFTTKSKDRLTVLSVLAATRSLIIFIINMPKRCSTPLNWPTKPVLQ